MVVTVDHAAAGLADAAADSSGEEVLSERRVDEARRWVAIEMRSKILRAREIWFYIRHFMSAMRIYQMEWIEIYARLIYLKAL